MIISFVSKYKLRNWIKNLKQKIFIPKVWAKNVGAHYTLQNMVACVEHLLDIKSFHGPRVNTKNQTLLSPMWKMIHWCCTAAEIRLKTVLKTETYLSSHSCNNRTQTRPIPNSSGYRNPNCKNWLAKHRMVKSHPFCTQEQCVDKIAIYMKNQCLVGDRKSKERPKSLPLLHIHKRENVLF